VALEFQVFFCYGLTDKANTGQLNCKNKTRDIIRSDLSTQNPQKEIVTLNSPQVFFGLHLPQTYQNTPIKL
jgi:hypothetical protein